MQIQLCSPHLIDQMLADSRYHQFDFLKNPPREPAAISKPTRKSKCGTCKKVAKKVTAAPKPYIDYDAIKQKIIELPFDRQQVLKKLLGCISLKFYYRDARGNMQRKVI